MFLLAAISDWCIITLVCFTVHYNGTVYMTSGDAKCHCSIPFTNSMRY